MFLSSCSGIEIESYKNTKPELKVKAFFNGSLTAYGIVKNRSGKVIRHFSATIDASWKDGVGTLDESFIFSDGEEQKRVWTLKEIDPNTYEATANDVIGSSHLRTAGNALFLKYVLEVPYKGSTIKMNVDDRMYLVDEKVLINESILTKWGFEMAYVTLTIIKND